MFAAYRGNAVFALALLISGACDDSRRRGNGGGDPNAALVDGAVGSKGNDPFPDPPPFDAGTIPPATGDAGPGGDGGTITPGSDAGTQAADAGSTVDAGVELTVRGCFPACVSASDCATGTSALFDAEHYECVNGGCRWLGCYDTFECTEAYFNENYACSPQAGLAMPSCMPTCSTVNDCPASTTNVYDLDNWACNGGLCQWTGCNSTQECVDDQGPDWVCESIMGSTVPVCVKTCSSSLDCDQGSPLFDTDNYRCDAGRCLWTGCNDGIECQQGSGAGSFICDEI